MPTRSVHLDDETDTTLVQVSQGLGLTPTAALKLIATEFLKDPGNLAIVPSAPTRTTKQLSYGATKTYVTLRSFGLEDDRKTITTSTLAAETRSSILVTHMHLLALREAGVVTGGDGEGMLSLRTWKLVPAAAPVVTRKAG